MKFPFLFTTILKKIDEKKKQNLSWVLLKKLRKRKKKRKRIKKRKRRINKGIHRGPKLIIVGRIETTVYFVTIRSIIDTPMIR